MAEYIGKSSVLYWIDRHCYKLEHHRPETVAFAEREKKYIRKLPAADVARVKHGYWTTNKYDFDECSACGYAQEHGGWEARNFCPRCGAKMDEEVKDG